MNDWVVSQLIENLQKAEMMVEYWFQKNNHTAADNWLYEVENLQYRLSQYSRKLRGFADKREDSKAAKACYKKARQIEAYF